MNTIVTIHSEDGPTAIFISGKKRAFHKKLFAPICTLLFLLLAVISFFHFLKSDNADC